MALLIACGIYSTNFQKAQYNNFKEKESKQNTLGAQSTQNSNSNLDLQPKTQSAKKDLQALQKVKVSRVIDGDTIELTTGEKVRYIGINTPETVHPQMSSQCFGEESSSKNKELVEGQVVYLEKDVSETDKYGRLLRYVYLLSQDSSQIFINDYLVREGYARVSTFPPDVKYQDVFLTSQKAAQQENLGLWTSCQSKNPNQSDSVHQTSSNGCDIKGNISSSGERIYHMPGQKYYDKTVINESEGEKWFCTEADAQKTGWRKSSI